MDPTAVTSMNTGVLKEPLGFIRIIQLPMAILAFATTAGYSATVQIPYSCTGAPPLLQSNHYEWGYPFDLTSIRMPGNFCDSSPTATQRVAPFGYGAMSQSQFFVCTGVLSFLYGLAISSVYLLSWNTYQKNPRWPMADFAMTGVLAIFWFIASCAWASGLTLVKNVTDPQVIGILLRGRSGSNPCKTPEGIATKMCIPTQTWNYSSLNISLIVGFACVGLWASNLWFIYKETVWYKNRMAAMNAGGPGGTPTGSQFGAPQQPGMTPGGTTIGRHPASDFQY